MTLPRRILLRSLAAAALAAVATAPALADEPFPSHPIHIVVPYAAGGTTDQLARAVQQPLSDFLKQPVIIDNKAGAGGAIGTEFVVKSPADGYTLVFGNTGPNAVLPLLRKSTPYDPLKDLRPISTVVFTPMILAVAASSPANNLKEFVALAKQHTDWNFGSVGTGSLSHLTGEYFDTLAGLKLTHIPYNGGAPMMTAFGGGQLQAAFVTGLDGEAMLEAGKIKYLAVGTPQRTPVLPGLPAIAEEVPGFRSIAWFGLLAPKGTPDPVIAKLHAAVAYAVARPEIQRLFAQRHVEAHSSTPEELEGIEREEMVQWGDVIRRANIHLD